MGMRSSSGLKDDWNLILQAFHSLLERIGNPLRLQSEGLHAHGDKAIVPENCNEIENCALTEHRFDASVRGIGDIALVKELLRKLVRGSLVAVLELGGQAFAQGFERAAVDTQLPCDRRVIDPLARRLPMRGDHQYAELG